MLSLRELLKFNKFKSFSMKIHYLSYILVNVLLKNFAYLFKFRINSKIIQIANNYQIIFELLKMIGTIIKGVSNAFLFQKFKKFT